MSRSMSDIPSTRMTNMNIITNEIKTNNFENNNEMHPQFLNRPY